MLWSKNQTHGNVQNTNFTRQEKEARELVYEFDWSVAMRCEVSLTMTAIHDITSHRINQY